MKITSITITETMNNRRQLADVSIVIDYGLMLSNIKLIDNGAKLFVDFPKSQRRESGFASPDVIPLTKRMRGYIEREIIREYFRKKGGDGVP